MPTRLFIASLGNPAPYQQTLHSAGHYLLHSILPLLPQAPLTQTPPYRSPVSIGPSYTFFPCPSLMNVSGPSIAAAYRTFLSTLSPSEQQDAKLVVLHDELEAELGRVKLKLQGSPKGHNGIKSIKSSMGGREFARIGVGIGRPTSREPNDVSNYVLRRMTRVEREAIEGAAGKVVDILDRLSQTGP